jgi:hypothetical protein
MGASLGGQQFSNIKFYAMRYKKKEGTPSEFARSPEPGGEAVLGEDFLDLLALLDQVA